MKWNSRHSHGAATTAFTLTDLLVVVFMIAVLVAIRVPALSRAKPPVQLVQCLSNCRQLALAIMLYGNDNNDAYLFGARAFGPYPDPTSWPMQLLPYVGYDTNTQPKVYLCPSEKAVAPNWRFQVHYQGNRMMLSDTGATDTPIYRAQVRNPAIYWLFSDKDPLNFETIKPGGMANPVLVSWNTAPGWSAYRRHSGGMGTAAADGHADWLRTPPYQLGRPPPEGFLELGDCAHADNPASTWRDDSRYVKLYSRYTTTGF